MFVFSVLKTAELFGVRSHEGQTDEPFPRWKNNFVQLAVRKLRRPQKLGLDWREHENKMAAGGWGMEPFIQLSYNEQCPKKTAKLPEIALVNKGKVPECFWLALLERKCPEGAYTLCDLWRFFGWLQRR